MHDVINTPPPVHPPWCVADARGVLVMHARFTNMPVRPSVSGTGYCVPNTHSTVGTYREPGVCVINRRSY